MLSATGKYSLKSQSLLLYELINDVFVDDCCCRLLLLLLRKLENLLPNGLANV